MSFTKRGRVQGSSIVFSTPVPLPEGAQVAVQIEALPEASAPSHPESAADLTSQPFFGMWANRPDMEDSAAWVEGERQRWAQRTTRQD